jgi:hypothetical protein
MGFTDALGGFGEAVGGLFGNGAASEDQQRSLDALKAALAQYQNLNPTDVNLLLKQAQTGSSNFDSTDPTGMDAQKSALSQLQSVYQNGGLRPEDRVAQEQATNAAAQASTAQQGAVMQNMASRGQLGGGAELAGRLAAQQNSAQNAHNAGSTAAANASQRALQAMLQSGQLGGQMNQQEQQKAAAKDALNRFNASQRMGAYQTNWGQQMDKAGGVANAQNNLSGYYGGQAQRTRSQYAGVGRAIGGAVGGGADAMTGGTSSAPYYLSNSTPNQKNWWEQ